MIRVKLERELDEEFVSDVLITAFDGSYGGCWYWAQSKAAPGKPSLEFQPGKSGNVSDELWVAITVQAKDGDLGSPALNALNEQGFRVDETCIQKGLQKIIDTWPATNVVRGYCLDAVSENDSGTIDSDAADCIVQVGLFGEIIYS